MSFRLVGIQNNDKEIVASINGTEYVYTAGCSATYLYSKVEGILRHSAGKALAYLKKQAVDYRKN